MHLFIYFNLLYFIYCNALFLEKAVVIVHFALQACKDIGLEVNAKMTKYVIMSRQQNVVQNQNTIGNLSTGNVQKFKYLGITVTNTKLHSWGNKTHNKHGKCVLLFT